jgi:hypothetical protein
MDLRLRSEDAKRERLEEKGELERAMMEDQASAKFSVHFIEWFHPKKHQGFIVNLRKPLSEDEIAARMAKGFGDLS